ncbi:MAG: S-layer homology domain-containing protein [Oscillospiraceae bacterium]|jgi:hypothetical protein|nr:S-layer homology domain-containing protein [Oscillospiraceae bacterium]
MRTSIRRRVLSLLLTLAMVLTLTPAAQLAEGDGGEQNPPPTVDTDPPDTTPDPPETTPDPPVTETITIVLYNGINSVTSDTGLTMNEGEGPTLNATIESASGTHKDDHIGWVSENTDIAEPRNSGSDDGHRFYVEGKKPGTTRITGTITDADGRPTGTTFSFPVTVSGISPKETTISIRENTSLQLKDAKTDPNDKYAIVYYGDAAESASVSITSDRPNVVAATGNSRDGLWIDGIAAGTAIVTITAGIYSARITVDVETNEAQTIEAEASVSSPLKFSTIESEIARQCQEMITAEGDKALVSITGLTVDTKQGTLYLGYKSSADTGMGVASSGTYFARTSPRGPYIQDISFVPNASYTGETATISYTGTAANGRTFKGKIEVTLEEVDTDLVLHTPQGKALGLTGNIFSEACQRETGSPLSYVTFTLPPVTEASLYTGYVSDINYGAKVTSSDRFTRADLDGLTFVPAEAYVGTVAIDYLGYSVSNARFSGQLVVRVTQDLDGGIVYNADGDTQITFDGADFNDFCLSVTGERLSSVSFNPPSENQGKLYYNYRPDRKNNTEVWSWDTYSYYRSSSSNSINDNISRITFVAADGFHGTVRIPFTGENRDGETFNGTVELHFQSEQAGEINYTCMPGGSVKLASGDFAQLCQQLTGQRLHYVSFQSLPAAAAGTIYLDRTSAEVLGSKAAQDTKYYNSAFPYLSDLSFWASENFRGSVEVPFTACAVSGETFTGLMVIRAAGDGTSGSGIRYETTGRELVTFNGDDFNTFCRTQSTGALNYVQFTTPSSSQGMLYFKYNASDGSTAQVTEADQYFLNGAVSVGKVSFLPAYGFSGVARIPFTAVTTGGKALQGAVEVVVHPDLSAGGSVRYASRGVPVDFNTADFSTGGVQPVSVRFTSLPSPQAGRLFYQYAGPTRYSWEASTTTEYHPGGDPSLSSLTFVPRAGYQGNVSIPYMALYADGTQFQGQVVISVIPAAASQYFNDLGNYGSETITAIDFLRDRGVVNGTGNGRFAPGDSIRRGDFSLMLWRAFQFENSGAPGSFADVPSSAYYASAVNTLSGLRIVNGTGSNRFQPNSTISRQDAAVMIQRTLQAAGMTADDGSLSALNAYSDGNQVSGYAQTAMACLIQQGLLRTGDGRLNPKANLTRADMAVLLHRAMTR